MNNNERIKSNNADLRELIEMAENLPDAETNGQYEEYNGEYEITPTVEAQTLLTANKLMTKNLLIKEIPYAEVTNSTNGTTVTIG